MNENKNLLSCPFCGGEAEIITTKHKGIDEEYIGKYIQCKECGCRTEKHIGYKYCCCLPNEAEVEKCVIERWNMRTCGCKKEDDVINETI